MLRWGIARGAGCGVVDFPQGKARQSIRREVAWWHAGHTSVVAEGLLIATSCKSLRIEDENATAEAVAKQARVVARYSRAHGPAMSVDSARYHCLANRAARECFQRKRKIIAAYTLIAPAIA
ncbi:hypothetical protein [Bordetella genomosp. 11]|uniref:hypothetical protein n=1 Tax=Bordetella genomosp. 11 TaxID=1416808 RepID=UPI00113FEDC9|nr:hypothetical protein [Bordetella genomosp. 11]